VKITRQQLQQIIKEELEAELLESDLEEGVLDYVRDLFRKKRKGGDIMSAPVEYAPGDFQYPRPSDYDKKLTYRDDLRADQEQRDRVSFGLMRDLSKNISFIADRSKTPEQYIRILQRMMKNIKGLHATDKRMRIQSEINVARRTDMDIEQIRARARAMAGGDEGGGYPESLPPLQRPTKSSQRVTAPEPQLQQEPPTQPMPQLPDTQILPTQAMDQVDPLADTQAPEEPPTQPMPQLPDTQILPRRRRTDTEKLYGKPISRRTKPLYNPPKR
jgi:hypothetical protein